LEIPAPLKGVTEFRVCDIAICDISQAFQPMTSELTQPRTDNKLLMLLLMMLVMLMLMMSSACFFINKALCFCFCFFFSLLT